MRKIYLLSLLILICALKTISAGIITFNEQQNITRVAYYNGTNTTLKSHIVDYDLFRDNVTADKAIPFIGFLSKRLINNIELLTVEDEQ